MMKKTAILSGLIAISGCVGGADVSDDFDNIVGGSNVDIADFPWQISMQTKSGFHFCGGSVLDEDFILTAAHCVDGASASQIRVAAGMTRQSRTNIDGQVRDVAEITMFPGYVDPTLGKDIAILRLANPLNLSDPNVSPIDIVTEADTAAGLTAPGVLSTVSGWGTLSSGGSSPDVLQAVDVPLISNAQANQAYTTINITDDQIGAGFLGQGGKDSCQGDSGGPLVVPDGNSVKLAGVVSYGFGCADPRFPGMYARVSAFEDFIVSRGGNDGGNDTQLQDGAARSLSGNQNSFTHFTMDVPANANRVRFSIAGGSGDADLYVRFGSQPTLNQFDCRPFRNGNNEVCEFSAPVGGTWHVSVRGFRAFSGVNLVGDFQ